MGLKGKLVSQRKVNCERDLFNLYKFPYQFSQIIPHKIQSVDLVSGRWGTVGSVIVWTYYQDGQKCMGKEIIEVVDEKAKCIVFKMIEGDLLKYYKSFKITLEVGEDNMVTWMLEYEKKSQLAVSDPTAFLDYLHDMNKDVEIIDQLALALAP